MDEEQSDDVEERGDHITTPGTHGYPSGTDGYLPSWEDRLDPIGQASRGDGSSAEPHRDDGGSAEPDGEEKWWSKLGFASLKEYLEGLEAAQAKYDPAQRRRRRAELPHPTLPGEEIANVPRRKLRLPVARSG